MVAPSLRDDVTGEPIAKPAQWAGFSIFRKEAQIEESTTSCAYYGKSFSFRGIRKTILFGGQHDF
jgi:hypothetical protein